MTRILLVEDNEMNLDMLSRRLRGHGYEVGTAEDGISAVAMAESELPELVLMDLSLPTMDGLEATRRLKASPSTRTIPVIALTAHALPEDKERSRAAGCDDYETKPIDFERLLVKIEALL